MGCGLMRSQYAYIARPTTPSPPTTTIVTPDIASVVSAGAWRPALLSAQASAASAAARIAAPITSNRRSSCRSCGANAATMPTTTSASGGFIQNTDCQPNVSTSQPPNTGPPAVVRADAAAHTPTARLRSSFG